MTGGAFGRLRTFTQRHAGQPLLLSTTEPDTDVVCLRGQPVTAEDLGAVIRLHLTPTACLTVAATDIDAATDAGHLLDFTVNGTGMLLETP